MGAFLDKPVTEKTSEKASGNGMTCVATSMQGWRTDMEDAHCAIPSVDGVSTPMGFFAVFDGHGGSLVARTSATHLLPRVLATEEFKSGDYKNALTRGFLELDQHLKGLSAMATGEDHSGSTGIACLVTKDQLFVANCGDSRGVLCRAGRAEALSEDQKPLNPVERTRIEAAGGTVSMGRVNGDLAVARALGDFMYKRRPDLPAEQQQVSAEPEVRVFARNPVEDQFFVLACDGIWDVVKNEECVEFISKRLRMHGDLQKAAEDLLDHCLGLNSRDNMSVVLVQLGDLPPMDPALQREYAAEQQKKAQQQQQRAEAAGRPGGK